MWSAKVAIDLLSLVDCGGVLLVGSMAFLAVVARHDTAWTYCVQALLGAVLSVNIHQIMGGTAHRGGANCSHICRIS